MEHSYIYLVGHITKQIQYNDLCTVYLYMSFNQNSNNWALPNAHAFRAQTVECHTSHHAMHHSYTICHIPNLLSVSQWRSSRPSTAFVDMPASSNLLLLHVKQKYNNVLNTCWLNNHFLVQQWPNLGWQPSPLWWTWQLPFCILCTKYKKCVQKQRQHWRSLYLCYAPHYQLVLTAANNEKVRRTCLKL